MLDFICLFLPLQFERSKGNGLSSCSSPSNVFTFVLWFTLIILKILSNLIMHAGVSVLSIILLPNCVQQRILM